MENLVKIYETIICRHETTAIFSATGIEHTGQQHKTATLSLQSNNLILNFKAGKCHLEIYVQGEEMDLINN